MVPARAGARAASRFAAWLAVAAFWLCVLASPSARAKFEVPPKEGPVTDTAQALDPEAKESLARKLAAVRAQTSYEVVIFVCPSLEGETVEDVAYETFNAWKLGQAGKDNGVLLVVAPNERKDRIEVGKGVEGALTDLESDDIRRKVLEPRLKAGDMAGGLDAAATAIARALVTDDPGAAYPRSQGRGSDFGSVVFFVFVLVFVIVVFASRGGRRGRARRAVLVRRVRGRGGVRGRRRLGRRRERWRRGWRLGGRRIVGRGRLGR